MPALREMYGWEVEHSDHSIICQYNEDGSENVSTAIRKEEVGRASIRHRHDESRRFDILIDRDGGERFVRRFGRGILKDRGDGFKEAEYIHCIETNRVRAWILSTTGQVLVTRPDFELYL